MASVMLSLILSLLLKPTKGGGKRRGPGARGGQLPNLRTRRGKPFNQLSPARQAGLKARAAELIRQGAARARARAAQRAAGNL